MIFSFVFISLLILTSVLKPNIAYDSWFYHLPISSYLFNIGGGSDSFIMSPSTYYRYLGYPLASEFIQGLFWKYTGSLNSIALLNSLSITALILYISRQFKINAFLIISCFFAVPAIGIHSISSYNDLFSGVLIIFQFLSVIKIIQHSNDTNGFISLEQLKYPLIIYGSSSIIAANTKFMNIAMITLVSMCLLYYIIFRVKNNRLLMTLFIIAVLLLSSATIMRNSVKFGNPFYPINTKIIPFIGYEIHGPEESEDYDPGYASDYSIMQRPIYYLFSLTELDWKIRGLKRLYNLDSNNGDEPLRYKPSRTGGFWGIYIFVNMLLFLYFIGSALRKKRKFLKFEIDMLIISVLIFLVTAFLPRSFQLRYYFYIPLLLIFINLYFLTKYIRSKIIRKIFPVFYLSCLFISYNLLPTQRLDIIPYPVNIYSSANVRKYLDKNILQVLDAGNDLCLDSKYSPNQFLYSRAVIGGNHRIEQAHQDKEVCKQLRHYSPK